MGKSRLEAFSDGVIAIIITIMVLEMKVPHGADWASLKPLLPVFLSYFLSFLFIGVYWGNHHHLLHTATRINSKIMLANLNLLFWLSLVPFVTGWMGGNHFAPLPVTVYAVLLNLCGMAYYILQDTILKGHSHGSAMKTAIIKQKRKGVISVFIYLASIPAVYIHPILSGILFLAVTIMWLIPDRNIEKAMSEEI